MKKREVVIILLLIISLTIVSLFQTFASDITMNEVSNTTADLSYKVDITDESGSSVTVAAGDSKIIDLFVTNTNNNGTITYGVGYTSESNVTDYVTIAKLKQEADKIAKSETKRVTVIILNNSSTSITLTLVPVTGYENGGKLIPPSGVHLIEKFYGDYKDPSGANAPELVSGLVPVEYRTQIDNGVSQDGWYVADQSTDWYNYNEQRWANAVLVTEESGLRTAIPGTPISEDDVLAYYVWIPRYSYQLFNASKQIGVSSYVVNSGINVSFESGTSSKIGSNAVTCQISLIGEETCQNAVDGNWYTHPAFWWDNDNDGNREANEELTGIWVSKFELSQDDPAAAAGAVRIKPNDYSVVYQNVSEFFNSIYSMSSENNEYGIERNETDSHMIKNMEWGSLVYLTFSKYGRCPNNVCTGLDTTYGFKYDFENKELGSENSDYYHNDNVVIKTGGNDYINKVGLSTTNNIYGIYDLSGGCEEITMGNRIYLDGKTMISGYDNNMGDSSGFNGILTRYDYTTYMETGIPYPNKKYYDVYSYNLVDDSENVPKINNEYYFYGDGMNVEYANHWGSSVYSGVNSSAWIIRGMYYLDHYLPMGGGGGAFMSTRAVLIKNP